jgi:hypothetical protein
MTRTAKAIRQVLIDLGVSNVPAEIKIQRHYPGHWQRSAGAWSWSAESLDGQEIAGSSDPCRLVIKAHQQGKASLSEYSPAPVPEVSA